MTIAIIALIVVYSKYNYNNFMKSVREKDKTEFTRDQEVKCSEMDSYKIENVDYNDAMFYETVDVTPNTPYKVTCKVKVKNVQNENNTKSGGAHISIANTTERSFMISQTQDWQELTFLFNSKNRDKVDISFRLGGYDARSKGTAWFSDFKIEKGVPNQNKNWNFVCFIFPNIDVNVEVNGKTEHIKLEMSNSDIEDLKYDMARFQTSMKEMSRNKMSVTYDIFTLTNPITTLSYDEENGYYVSAEDVYNYIQPYVAKKEYDHIYIGIRMADIQKGSTALTNDWIGLGGMEYYGMGYSNIRLPDSENNLAYKYDPNYNIFPEEVYMHEFLHTLERNAESYGYEIPALHDYEKYGYVEDRLEGQKKWYIDYMNKQINDNGKMIGLPPEVFTYKPVHESDFKYSIAVNALKEPSNIIEVIRSVIDRIGNMFNYYKNNESIEFSGGSVK